MGKYKKQWFKEQEKKNCNNQHDEKDSKGQKVKSITTSDREIGSTVYK